MARPPRIPRPLTHNGRLPVWLGAVAVAAGCASPLDWPDSPAVQEAKERSELRRYTEAFRAAMGDEFSHRATRAEFLATVEQQPTLFLGDNHRDAVLHRHHVELLLDLHERAHRSGRPLCLLLECVGQQDQGVLDDYLQGKCSMDALRAAILDRWPGSWLDDITLDKGYYVLLIELARANRWPVLALEPTPRLPLAQRDPHMATTLTAAAERFPDHRLVVVIGQTHLLGSGNLVGRIPSSSTAVGASVTPRLRGVAVRDRLRDDFVGTDAGLWFFGDHMPIRATSDGR